MWKIGVRKICFVKQLVCESTVVLNYRRAKTLSLEAPVVQNNCHTKYRNWLLCKIWCSERENVGSISPWEKWQCMHAETGSKDPSHINVNFLPTQYIKPSLSQHANCSQTWPAEWNDAEVPDLHMNAHKDIFINMYAKPLDPSYNWKLYWNDTKSLKPPTHPPPPKNKPFPILYRFINVECWNHTKTDYIEGSSRYPCQLLQRYFLPNWTNLQKKLESHWWEFSLTVCACLMVCSSPN